MHMEATIQEVAFSVGGGWAARQPSPGMETDRGRALVVDAERIVRRSCSRPSIRRLKRGVEENWRPRSARQLNDVVVAFQAGETW